MLKDVVELAAMPDIEQYVTPEEAARLEGMPFSSQWIRKLAEKEKIPGKKVGGMGRGGKWLIHLPSLMDYIKKMEELGTKKHSPHDS